MWAQQVALHADLCTTSYFHHCLDEPSYSTANSAAALYGCAKDPPYKIMPFSLAIAGSCWVSSTKMSCVMVGGRENANVGVVAGVGAVAAAAADADAAVAALLLLLEMLLV